MPRSTIRWVALVLAALVVLSIAAAAVAAPASPGPAPGAKPAPKPVTWSVQPATKTKPDHRATFTYQRFTPGSTHHDYVAVDNFSTRAHTFAVYASDAFNTDAGGFDLLPAAKQPVDVGSWVHLARSTVRVPARSSVIVPFTLTIPKNATPGFHVGGIVASASTAATDASGSRVRVDRRVGVRIYLQVSGPLHPVLTVEHLKVTYHGGWDPIHSGSATVDYTLANTGNVPLQAHQSLKVAGLFGVFGTSVAMKDAPLLLPGNSVHLHAAVPHAWPEVRATATVHVAPFTTVIELPDAPAAFDAHASTWAMPWTWLIVLLVLVAAISWWWLRRRATRRAVVGQDHAPRPPAKAQAHRT